MKNEALGAYMRALCHCWIDGHIPSSEDELCLLTRSGPKIVRVVKAMFKQHPTDETLLVHDRLDEEREKQRVWAEKSAYGGRRSAEARKQAKSSTVVQPPLNHPSTTLATVVQPNVNISSSSSSSSSSSNSLKKKVKKESEPFPIPLLLNTPEFIEHWESFLQMRKEIKKPMFDTAKSRNLKKLEEMGLQRAIAALEFSTMRQYQGIFEPPSEQRNPMQSQSHTASSSSQPTMEELLRGYNIG